MYFSYIYIYIYIIYIHPPLADWSASPGASGWLGARLRIRGALAGAAASGSVAGAKRGEAGGGPHHPGSVEVNVNPGLINP